MVFLCQDVGQGDDCLWKQMVQRRQHIETHASENSEPTQTTEFSSF